MTHIITSLCLRDGACVDVCPVECIIPGQPEMRPFFNIRLFAKNIRTWFLRRFAQLRAQFRQFKLQSPICRVVTFSAICVWTVDKMNREGTGQYTTCSGNSVPGPNAERGPSVSQQYSTFAVPALQTSNSAV